MLIGLIVLVAMLASGAGVAFLYERVLKLAPTNFAGVHKLTPLEQLAAAGMPQTTGLAISDPVEPAFTQEEFRSMFMSDDEEDIKHMVDTGRIKPEQIPDVLDALGIVNEVPFS